MQSNQKSVENLSSNIPVPPKKRTRADLLPVMVDLLMPHLTDHFTKEVLPLFTLSPWAKEVISEEEYNFYCEQFRIEAPYFARQLLKMDSEKAYSTWAKFLELKGRPDLLPLRWNDKPK